MIRPSSLSIARYCDLSPVLSERFPSRNANTDRGQAVDDQVKDAMSANTDPVDPDAVACVEWLRKYTEGAVGVFTSGELELRGDDGNLITKGTPDIVVVYLRGREVNVCIIDLKKQEQYDAGRLSEADDNDQLHAYALAACQKFGAVAYHLVLLLFGSGRVRPLLSKIYDRAAWTPVLDRITSICAGKTAEPKGQSGDHCARCYPRLHCPHWALPAHETALEPVSGSPLAPLSEPGQLTEENAGRAVLAYQAVKEVLEKAKETLQAYVDTNGPIKVGERQWGKSFRKGRETWDYKAMERDGLAAKYTRTGSSYEQYGWSKRK